MSDASTTQPHTAETPDTEGHGKHRGPVSSHDGETAPSGRHRKPVQEHTEVAA
ncbi:hypothetical protein [Streptomyces carpinensis]|uniref:Uncharacterized protein n=1 Tax=Streptomyces carpinensis TaxID=66369 RepID=A0ABV1WBE7_9ACTN|nr:hypothetical protein [Streptomyces carpinensis]